MCSSAAAKQQGNKEKKEVRGLNQRKREWGRAGVRQIDRQ